jgi:hypothetical protein
MVQKQKGGQLQIRSQTKENEDIDSIHLIPDRLLISDFTNYKKFIKRLSKYLLLKKKHPVRNMCIFRSCFISCTVLF